MDECKPLAPGAVVAEEGNPADAILIIKRGGLVVTSRPLNPQQDARPRLIRERDVFGTVGRCRLTLRNQS